jgi:serine/threonine-protein kinase
MGAVYEAIQEPIERRVAIKILHGRYAQEPEIAARFFNEARAVNIVDHPGIVQISDYGQMPNGVAYLVMEYLKGETLTQRMKRGGGHLPQPEAMRLGRQIAAALAAAHEKGIIHRDLKPDNVMLIVDPDPEAMGRVRAKLLDFGIAKVAAEVGQGNAAHTAADVVMGTPKYMSPEQCRGAANVDDKSDVYALGVMIYEMLAGRVPFMGATGEILAKQIYEDPPALTEIAPWVSADAAAFVHRLLKKDKAERPTMRQVATELERMTAPFPTMAHSVVLPPPPAQQPTGETPRQNPEDAITNPSMAAPAASFAAAGAAGSAAGLSGKPGERDTNSGLQPHSTLGFSVGQSSLSMRTPTRWRRILLPAGAVLVAASAILVAVSLREHNGPQPVRPAVVKPPAKKIFWSLSSVPAGAEIIRISDNKVLGKTPWHGEQDPQNPEIELRLSLAGYQDRILKINAVENNHREVTLDPLPPEDNKAQAAQPQPLKKRPLWPRSLTGKPATAPNARPKIVD